MDERILKHCREIQRCNQRGGRMLSMVDLIEAGTITPDLAAYALAVIGKGASFLVGANPGGAGKTTVMGALLNFLPPEVELAPADGMEAIRRGLGPTGETPPELTGRMPVAHTGKMPVPHSAGRRCFICHEIGSGPYYAYLWGEELRAYFDLPLAGHVLATNLHADTCDQARRQICQDNDVPAPALRRMNLMFFLAVGRSGGRVWRRIAEVWESDGQDPHRLVFSADGGSPAAETSALAAPAEIAQARQRLDQLLAGGARTIEDVRRFVLSSAG